jgi:hypothetical protein
VGKEVPDFGGVSPLFSVEYMFIRLPADPGRVALFGPSPRRHPVQRRLNISLKRIFFIPKSLLINSVTGM